MKKLTLLLLTLLLVGCSKKQEVYSYNMFYMDTYININIYNIDDSKKEEISKKINNIYKEYHELSNRYEEYENIKNIYYINNILDNDVEMEIDEKLYELIDYSITYCNDSNRLLNIAMGNVINIWKQYRDGTKKGIPTKDELIKNNNINIEDLILLDNNKILKKNNISLDLGAFAKGYATEKVGQYLESVNIKEYIINAGGNVKVGNHYNNSKYKIGIEEPIKDGGIYKTIKGNNIAVTTSGSYERFYEYNGEIYHHIIDPTTFFPPNYMLSVTVISKDSAYADALDTMLFLMPINKGIEYVDKLDNVEAIWYGIDNKIYYSKGFSKYE